MALIKYGDVCTWNIIRFRDRLDMISALGKGIPAIQNRRPEGFLV